MSKIGQSQLTILDIIQGYQGYIQTIIEFKMSNQSLASQDEVYNKIIEVLEKKIGAKELELRHGIPSLKTYIRRVTESKCNDYFRRLKRRPKTLSHREARRLRRLDSIMTEIEIVEALKKIGLSLGEIKNHPVFMLRLQGKTRKEIAEIFGLSIEQVKGRLEYTRKKLKEDHRLIRSLDKVLEKEDRFWLEPKRHKKWRKKKF